MTPQSHLYEYLEDHDNPELSGYDWDERMIEALEQYYNEHPDRYRMKYKNAIQNYRSWKLEKYSALREPEY